MGLGMNDDTSTIRLILESVAAIGVIGSGVLTLLRLGAIGERIVHHGKQLEKIDTQLDQQDEKLDEQEKTLATIAVQKEEIRSVRDALTLAIKRTDETFGRIFDRLDRKT